ncbi:unnamed protein product, partial [Didymodactylos carnosus]
MSASASASAIGHYYPVGTQSERRRY